MAVNDTAIPAADTEEAGNSISELAALIPGGHLLPTAAEVTTEEALNARLLEAQQVEDWALANLDGATIRDAEGNEQFIDGADVRKYLINARKVLREGPRKLALIAAQAEDEVLARSINPEMWTPGTEAYTAAQEVLRVFPEMKRIPDYRSFIADWHAGYTARVAKAAAAAKVPARGEPGKAKAPKVKLAPGAPKGGAVPKVPGKQVAVEQARENVFKKGGSQEALESYFSQT